MLVSIGEKHTRRTAFFQDYLWISPYYIEGGIGMGFWAGRPQLSEVTKPILDKVKPDLKYIRLATPEEAAQFKEKEQKRDSGTPL